MSHELSSATTRRIGALLDARSHAPGNELPPPPPDPTRRVFEELLQRRDEVEQLHAALESRAVIDQAKGIVMAYRALSADEAFQLLTRCSQDRNVKVRVLAEALVAQMTGGQVPAELWPMLTSLTDPASARGMRAPRA